MSLRHKGHSLWGPKHLSLLQKGATSRMRHLVKKRHLAKKTWIAKKAWIVKKRHLAKSIFKFLLTKWRFLAMWNFLAMWRFFFSKWRFLANRRIDEVAFFWRSDAWSGAKREWPCVEVTRPLSFEIFLKIDYYDRKI